MEKNNTATAIEQGDDEFQTVVRPPEGWQYEEDDFRDVDPQEFMEQPETDVEPIATERPIDRVKRKVMDVLSGKRATGKIPMMPAGSPSMPYGAYRPQIDTPAAVGTGMPEAAESTAAKRPLFPTPTYPSAYVTPEQTKELMKPIQRGALRNLPLAAANAFRALGTLAPTEMQYRVSGTPIASPSTPYGAYQPLNVPTEKDYTKQADEWRERIMQIPVPEPDPEMARAPESFSEWVQPKRIWTAFWENAPLTVALGVGYAVNPIVGTALMAAVEGGGSKEAIDDYEKQTGVRLSEAQRRGIPIAVGAVNAALEKTGIETLLGKGPLGKIAKNHIVKTLISAGTESSTEALQELVSIYGELGYDENAAADMGQRTLQSFYGGLVTGGILGGAIPSGRDDVPQTKEYNIDIGGEGQPVDITTPATPTYPDERTGTIKKDTHKTVAEIYEDLTPEQQATVMEMIKAAEEDTPYAPGTLTPEQEAEIETTGAQTAEAETKPDTEVKGQKEPWEMTRDEWIADYKNRVPNGRLDDSGLPPKSYVIEHDLAVKYALGEGKPVPHNVLLSNPDGAEHLLTKNEYDSAWKRGLSRDVSPRHKEHVETAINQGKPVPEEVLKDYPDLLGTTPKESQTKPKAEAKEKPTKKPKWYGDKLLISGDAITPAMGYIRRAGNHRGESEMFDHLIVGNSPVGAEPFLTNPNAEEISKLKYDLRRAKGKKEKEFYQNRIDKLTKAGDDKDLRDMAVWYYNIYVEDSKDPFLDKAESWEDLIGIAQRDIENIGKEQENAEREQTGGYTFEEAAEMERQYNESLKESGHAEEDIGRIDEDARRIAEEEIRRDSGEEEIDQEAFDEVMSFFGSKAETPVAPQESPATSSTPKAILRADLTTSLVDTKDARTGEPIETGEEVYYLPDTKETIKESTYRQITERPEQEGLFAPEAVTEKKPAKPTAPKTEKKAPADIMDTPYSVQEEAQTSMMEGLTGQRNLFAEKPPAVKSGEKMDADALFAMFDEEAGEGAPESAISETPAETVTFDPPELIDAVNRALGKTWVKDYPENPAYRLLSDQELSGKKDALPKHTNDMTEEQKADAAAISREQQRRYQEKKLAKLANDAGEYKRVQFKKEWPNGNRFPANSERVTAMYPGLFGLPMTVDGIAKQKKNGTWYVDVTSEAVAGNRKPPLTQIWKPIDTAAETKQTTADIDAIAEKYGIEPGKQSFIVNKVKKLGTYEAVAETYKEDTDVDQFAREAGKVLYGEESKETTAKPFKDSYVISPWGDTINRSKYFNVTYKGDVPKGQSKIIQFRYSDHLKSGEKPNFNDTSEYVEIAPGVYYQKENFSIYSSKLKNQATINKAIANSPLIRRELDEYLDVAKETPSVPSKSEPTPTTPRSENVAPEPSGKAEGAKYVVWALPKGETDSVNEVPLTSKEISKSDADKVIFAAKKDGYHGFRLMPMEGAPDFVGAIKSKAEGADKFKASRIRKIADTMEKQIQAKEKPAIGEQNVTARRARIAGNIMEEARTLRKVQTILHGIANDIEQGTLPEELNNIDTKSKVEDIARRDTFEAYRPAVNEKGILEVMRALKGKPGIGVLRPKIDRVLMGRVQNWVYVDSDAEVSALSELLKIAQKYIPAHYEANQLARDFTEVRRFVSSGVTTKNTFDKVKKHFDSYITPESPEQVKHRRVKELEREMIGVNIPGFFPTPKPIADKLVDTAGIKTGMSVLEPSAGMGNIVESITDKTGVTPDMAEVNGKLAEILKEKYGVEPEGDFLEMSGEYDRIVMNPPFEKGQDIDHVSHAYKLLKPGGRLVSIMSEGVFFRGDKKATEFREWLEEVNGRSEKLPEKAFTGKDAFRQTGVASRMVVIDKTMDWLKRVASEESGFIALGSAIQKHKDNPRALELSPETRWQYFQRVIQDKLNRLAYYQGAIPNLSEEADAYMKAELFIGKAADKIERMEKAIVDGKDSFLKRLSEAGYDIQQFGEYLYARHAKERNKRIQSINPKFLQTDLLNDSGGSGMTDAEADVVLEQYADSGMDVFAEEFYEKITRAALKIKLDAGIIDQYQYDTLTGMYENYVPLKGKAGETSYRSIGKGFSVSSKGIKKATGRMSYADNPFVQAIIDYEDAVVSAEKNTVGQSLLKLVRENPSDIWDSESQAYIPQYDARGELLYMNPKQKPADNVLEVWENGKKILITLHDNALAEGMKNLANTMKGSVARAMSVVASVNNYMRAVATFYNPEFLLTNFERDLQTAMIHLSGEQSVKLAAKVGKDLPKAMNGIWSNVREGKPGEWSKLYDELKATGGKVGWFDYKTLEQKQKHFESKVRFYQTKTDPRKIFIETGKFVSDLNEAVESGVRLSAYKNLIDAGVSKEKAAQAAKNLTVNFNKKGDWGTILNTLYLFSNAGIQGTARIIKAAGVPFNPKTKGQRRVQKIIGGIIVASFLQSLANRMSDDDDYERISDYNKDNYWLFMTPSGKAVAIKLPYGYNVFHVLGCVAEESVFGDITLGEASKRVINAANDAFNPLGGGSIAQFLSPSFLDPIVQISENKNFFGAPIMPEQPQWGEKKPDSQRYFKSVRKPTKAFTDWLNSITGGDEEISGAVDVSPETLDHFIDFAGSGLGKFITNTMTTAGTVIGKGELPPMDKIPFVRQMIKEFDEWTDKRLIREMLDESKRTKYSDEQKARFERTLKRLKENKEYTPKEAREMGMKFRRNQR